ncbi:MAG: tetratricopeptide repeat protein [Planctomycetes bacterium]|nr:tetratricopeptide repeat protein [Planctomycetota bacterium]
MFRFIQRLFQRSPLAAAQPDATEPRSGAPQAVSASASSGLNLPAVPKVLSNLDDHSRQVVIEISPGNVMLMDRDSFDYVYGNSTAPNPTQRDLDELLPRVDRVRAVAGGIFRGRATSSEVVVDTTDGAALAELREVLQIVEEPAGFSHCSCAGGPTLELFAKGERIATIGIQHGHSIRWERWKPDAELRNGEALPAWLIKHGFLPEFLAASLGNQYDGGGLMPIGLVRGGDTPLTLDEQRIRVAELSRVHGGDPQETLAVCQTILDTNPRVALAYVVRAQIRRDQGDYAGCVADCSTAIQLELCEAEVFYMRAVALDNLGRPEEALADCNNALKIDPAHAGPWNSRGLIRGRLGMFAEALLDFAEAVRIAPEWSLLYLNRGAVNCQLGDYQAAIPDFDRVIERLGPSAQPDDVRTCGFAYWNRGRCHEALGSQTDARADFQEARRRCPEIGRQH